VQVVEFVQVAVSVEVLVVDLEQADYEGFLTLLHKRGHRQSKDKNKKTRKKTQKKKEMIRTCSSTGN
jgi:hypothetical protein